MVSVFYRIVVLAALSKSPQDFAALMKSETAKWAKLVGTGRIKLD